MQYDDDQCPARGAGLGHIADGEPDCSFCGVARQRHRPPTPTVRRIEPRRQVMSGDHSAPTPGDPIAELRARFIAQLFCTVGNHATDYAYAYGGRQYCPEHRPEPAAQDLIPPGLCQWSKPHQAHAVRWFPGLNRGLCSVHLAQLLADYWRRGDYGRRHG